MSAPCPVCELARIGALTEALALGAGLGVAFHEMHRVTALVCERHRVPWSVAMMRVSQRLSEAADADHAALKDGGS